MKILIYSIHIIRLNIEGKQEEIQKLKEIMANRSSISRRLLAAKPHRAKTADDLKEFNVNTPKVLNYKSPSKIRKDLKDPKDFHSKFVEVKSPLSRDIKIEVPVISFINKRLEIVNQKRKIVKVSTKNCFAGTESDDSAFIDHLESKY